MMNQNIMLSTGRLVKLILKSTVCIFILFIANNAQGQHHFFENYSVKEGLGQSSVYSIQQDDGGYIWLSTASGVSRFDGKNFTNFNTENGLSSGGIRTIYQDSIGRIWFGHNSGGISYFHQGTFTKVDIGKIEHDITSIIEDKNHHLWISTFGSGCYRITNPYDKPENYQTDRFAGDKGLSDRISQLVYTKKYGIMFILDFGVKIAQDDSTFIYAKDIFQHWPAYFSVITVKEDRKGNLWLGTHNGGVYIYKNKTDEPKILDIRDGLGWNWISNLFEASNGTMWIGTWGGGITKFENNTLYNYNNNNGLNGLFVRSIAEDYEGNILIGDKEKGLFIFKGDAFIDLSNIFPEGRAHVHAINRFENIYLIGTDDGLFKYNSESTEGISIENFNKENETKILSNQTRFIRQDNNGKFWIGTWGGGVYIYNPQTNKIESNYIVNHLLNNLSRGDVSAMTINKHNELYVGTYEGLIYYSVNDDQYQVLTHSYGLAANDITALYSEPKGTVWVGSRGKGISKILKDTIIRVDLKLDLTPTCFLKTNEGVWVGTEGIGALLINDTVVIQKLKASNGLLSDMIATITSDKDGNIYFGTNRGLSVWNPKTQRITSFGPQEGFTGIEVKHDASFFDENHIWFGTIEGLTKFIPNEHKKVEVAPLLKINRLRVNLEDKDLVERPVFAHDQNSILFDYKAISITNAEKIRYQVMLEGADKDWQPITENTFSNYSALPPGNYIFKVKAINSLGQWTKPVTFEFTIKPPFWLTWWFFTIVAIALISAVITYVKIRERNLKREKAILEAKVQQRTQQIREANQLLAQKNKDITDSINYARRIQTAIMPSVQTVSKNTFIYYRPKDIVSGDFYWFAEHKGKIIIAAADCTGHGVPGAFMSMISISGLNQIVREKGVTDPGKILNQLRDIIINDLTQSGDGIQKDGLDIALLTIDPKTKQLEYAGAYNSLFVRSAQPVEDLKYNFKYTVFENSIIEVKADRMPIGMSDRLDQTFETKTLSIQKGDAFFISSDGYIDQFGGEEGKKFMSKKFKETLLQLPHNQTNESIKLLENTYNNWKGEYEQIDDVLVIGLYF
ncbi:MAG: SpoIIE family protein phosphatase [Bacteroidales bacterium]|nr:SpoIIE family protein phosphatase [Bacteroidales bacterium]